MSKNDMTTEIKEIDTEVYACRVKDKNVLMKSSSGGAFTAISDYFLQNENAILCTVYNYTEHEAEFRIITTKKERDAARGSKYMQSNPHSAYKEALAWLKNNPNKNILFVGVGCQADGFRKFIEVTGFRNRVWIVDLICHGSPSPMLWRDYAEYLEKKYGGNVSELSFKDKRNGWILPTARVTINNKEVLIDEYVKIFYDHCALRPSCHKCPFAKIERETDITIGDFWHIEEKMPDFYNKNGNSLLLIHTNRGKVLFDNVKGALEYKESNVEDCWQVNLEMPTPVSKYRAKFWKKYRRKGVGYVMKKYGKVSISTKVKNKVIGILKECAK